MTSSQSAQKVSWEVPVPVNPFRDDLPWVICAPFFWHFDSAELSNPPIDPSNAAGLTEKERIAVLLELLQEKFKAFNETGGKEGGKDWSSLLRSIVFLQQKSGLVKSAGVSVRALVAAEEKSSGIGIVSKQVLAQQLIDEGDYTGAEEIMRPACIEVDGPERKWKFSPQSVGYRRTLLEALWKQGVEKRKEAEELVEEIWGLIEGMRGGTMEVYVESEKETLEERLEKLKGV